MIRCSCGASFAPTTATFHAPQVFTDSETGASWLYLLLHNCPVCASTRALVLFDATGGEEEELEAADLVDDCEPLFSAERDCRGFAAAE